MDLQVKDLVKRPILFKLFLLKKLPLAFFAGLRLEHIESQYCVTSLPYRWLTQNPFNSMYFAAQSMAAEFSTGALLVFIVNKLGRKFGMLIVNMEAEFVKKATSRVTFTCKQGSTFIEAALDTSENKKPVIVRVKSEGHDEKGELVSTFYFTCSIVDQTASEFESPEETTARYEPLYGP